MNYDYYLNTNVLTVDCTLGDKVIWLKSKYIFIYMTAHLSLHILKRRDHILQIS